MRAELEAAVAKANEETVRELKGWETTLTVINREVLEREKKVRVYLKELKDLRDLHARYKMERLGVRQRARQVLDELSREDPVIGKARRLVKKIIKLT